VREAGDGEARRRRRGGKENRFELDLLGSRVEYLSLALALGTISTTQEMLRNLAHVKLPQQAEDMVVPSFK
jgi:hypothetical protein